MIVSEASHIALQKAAKAYRLTIELQSLAADLNADFPTIAAQVEAAGKSLITRAKKLEAEKE
jgi:hypothetical protein